jgi:hypothetical protein
MKWLMQWSNLLPNPEPVLIVICPLCPSLYGCHGGMMFFVQFLNEVSIFITKKKVSTIKLHNLQFSYFFQLMLVI